MLDLGRLDPYVRWALRKSGWTPEREFPLAEAYLKEILALGFPAACFASPAAWLMADVFLVPAYFWCCRRLSAPERVKAPKQKAVHAAS